MAKKVKLPASQVAQIQATLDADPEYQAWKQAHPRGASILQNSGDRGAGAAQLYKIRQRLGIPDGYAISQKGIGPLVWNPDDPWWKSVAIIGALGLGGYGLSMLPAFGAAAAGGTAASTGTAAGTTLEGVLAGGEIAPAAAGIGSGTAAATAGTAAIGKSIYDRIGGVLQAGGRMAGSAAEAAGNNRLTADEVARRSQSDFDQLSERSLQDFENSIQGRSKLESDQRNNALKDVYRQSWYANRQPGPNNTRGLPALSPEFMATLTDLEKQAVLRLQQDPQYGTNVMPALSPYKPTLYRPTSPSGAERAGTWLAPTLGILGSIFTKGH